MSIPPLMLTPEQTSCLLDSLQQWRRHLLTQFTPSTGRNSQQRLMQALQGKLMQESAQPAARYQFALSGEEIAALKTMAAELLALTAREPASPKRDAALRDLAELKAAFERWSVSASTRSTLTLFST